MIPILTKHDKDFLQMYKSLKQIMRHTKPQQIRRACEKKGEVSYEEFLEMAYENVLNEASFGIKNVRLPKKIIAK